MNDMSPSRAMRGGALGAPVRTSRQPGDKNVLPILGVAVTDVVMEEALAMVEAMLTTQPPRSHGIYFVNAHTLNTACDEPAYREVLNAADRVFGDGTGVRWGARLIHGKPLKDNVNGTDLTPLLFTRFANRGFKYFLLGNTPERIGLAAEHTRKTYPGWELAGFHHGYLKGRDSMPVIEQINASGAHMLLVGMGNPLQEQWIHDHLPHLKVPVCMAIGGLTDYWVGDLVRAPAWVRRLGYEWLHLLIRQPKKARRYLLGNPLFLARVLRSRLLGLDKQPDTKKAP
jgi:N-acetylglucosaminyldiphosphoundecaprenol N-acetyl-beta-D-mannosaminyltransferase